MVAKNKKENEMDILNDIFGGGVMHLESEDHDDQFDNVIKTPSGIVQLNDALGGGYPQGRVIEVFGLEASGKTWLVSKAYAEAQRLGLTCLHIDVENSYNLKFAKALGVKTKDLIFWQPGVEDYAEKILEAVYQAIINEDLKKRRKIDVIGIDSTAALIPKAELDSSIEKQDMALLARVMSKALRKISNAANTHGTTVFFINQLREVPGQMAFRGKTPTTTPGGKALKFYSSVRIECTKQYYSRSDRSDLYDGDGTPIGHVMKAKIIKNKTYFPHKEALIDLMYKPKRRLIATLEDCYENGTLEIFEKNPRRHKSFTYLPTGDKGALQEKKDWDNLVSWLKENRFFFDFLERADMIDEESIAELIESKDLTEEEVEEYNMYKETGEWPEPSSTKEDYLSNAAE